METNISVKGCIETYVCVCFATKHGVLFVDGVNIYRRKSRVYK